MKEHTVLAELRRLCGAGGLRGRLRIDQRWYGSPFLAVEPFVPARGRIVDAGCGFGMFAAILALRSGEREVYGLDIDAGKIARARAWFGGVPGVRFEARDLGEWAGGSGRGSGRGDVDCVVFYDVLHHLRAELIGQVLAAARAALREGGVLVIKENDTGPAWKYAVSCLVERVAVGSGLTQSDPVVFRGCAEWAGLAAQAGFTVEHAAHLPAREGFFVPHSLILGRA